MNAKQAYNTSFENENIVNYVEKEIFITNHFMLKSRPGNISV